MKSLDYSLLPLERTLSMRRKSRASHYRDIADRLFPSPIRVGKRAVAWPRYEVDQVIAAQISGKTEHEIRALVARIEAERVTLGRSE